MSDDKVVDIGEKILAKKLEATTPSVFGDFDAHIENEGNRLIDLAENGKLADFTAMRPINPSVVHWIVLKLLNKLHLMR